MPRDTKVIFSSKPTKPKSNKNSTSSNQLPINQNKQNSPQHTQRNSKPKKIQEEQHKSWFEEDPSDWQIILFWAIVISISVYACN